eukprot:Hpha_TRINITY_DN7995_c0_g1::TRINITY_DN7995_c0_g1_i1::g.146227::m.146227
MADRGQTEPSLSTIAQVKALLISRNELLTLAKKVGQANLKEKVCGLFVRALLDEECDGKNYHLARINDVETGDPYDGFSMPGEYSTCYFVLEMPRRTLWSGTRIPLNSVSNSELRQDEFQTYFRSAKREGVLPKLNELRSKAMERRQFLPQMGLEVPNQCHPDTFRAPLQPPAPVRPAPKPSAQEPEAKRRRSEELKDRDTAAEQELRSERDQLKMKVEQLKGFPRNLELLDMDGLKELEDEVAQYLATVRSRQRELTMCKICMDRESVVVLLPCKHLSLCVQCSDRVQVCPLCRVDVTDRILPHRC